MCPTIVKFDSERTISRPRGELLNKVIAVLQGGEMCTYI
jgi:hypothetical protein